MLALQRNVQLKHRVYTSRVKSFKDQILPIDMTEKEVKKLKFMRKLKLFMIEPLAILLMLQILILNRTTFLSFVNIFPSFYIIIGAFVLGKILTIWMDVFAFKSVNHRQKQERILLFQIRWSLLSLFVLFVSQCWLRNIEIVKKVSEDNTLNILTAPIDWCCLL